MPSRRRRRTATTDRSRTSSSSASTSRRPELRIGETTGARVARYATVAAVVAALATIAIIGLAIRPGERPEEDAAREFLGALFRGDADATYGMTTVAYRSIVFPGEHGALVRTISSLTGRSPQLEILGSERSPGTQPLESLVGYKADTATGPLEGVVTLRELDDGWAVSDYSYRFTDPPPGATEELEALTRQLNEQLVERAGRLDAPGATPEPEGATPSGR